MLRELFHDRVASTSVHCFLFFFPIFFLFSTLCSSIFFSWCLRPHGEVSQSHRTRKIVRLFSFPIQLSTCRSPQITCCNHQSLLFLLLKRCRPHLLMWFVYFITIYSSSSSSSMLSLTWAIIIFFSFKLFEITRAFSIFNQFQTFSFIFSNFFSNRSICFQSFLAYPFLHLSSLFRMFVSIFVSLIARFLHFTKFLYRSV